MRAQKPASLLTIAKSDYDAVERLLGDIQGAFSTEDLSALRTMVTPEMLSYFSEQLAGNASRGLFNRVTDVKLLQGDLAEAWREGRTDYATVAMKYVLKDSIVERASRRTVEGGERIEVTKCARVAAIGCPQPSSREPPPDGRGHRFLRLLHEVLPAGAPPLRPRSRAGVRAVSSFRY